LSLRLFGQPLAGIAPFGDMPEQFGILFSCPFLQDRAELPDVGIGLRID